MDIARPHTIGKRFQKRLVIGTVCLTTMAGITVGLTRLKPAAPGIDRNRIYTDTVKRGEMIREVRGNGTLVPEEVKWIPAGTAGRVERILVLPGADVKADTILLELSNPEVEHAVFEAEWQLKAGEARFARLKAQLESDRLTQEAQAAQVRAEYTVARLDAEADAKLAAEKLVDRLTAMRCQAKAEQLSIRSELEAKRLKNLDECIQAQITAEEAEVERLRAVLQMRRAQLAKLKVRSGINGVLQRLGEPDTLQTGQQIPAGATLARVANPARLRAEIKVVATQVRDVVPGQKAVVDTRTGKICGRVMRVDPAVLNGTVAVEIRLEGALPRGARPDLAVEAVIELEKLEGVLFVGRPVQAQADTPTSVFRLKPGTSEAHRVEVRLGRTSVNTVEVLAGLEAGDTILLNDMAQFAAHDRIRLE